MLENYGYSFDLLKRNLKQEGFNITETDIVKRIYDSSCSEDFERIRKLQILNALFNKATNYLNPTAAQIYLELSNDLKDVSQGITIDREEQKEKGRAVGDFLFYCQYVFTHYHKREFQVYNYHREICHHLMSIFNGYSTRLIINIPPRYGKTNLAVILFISWSLGRCPDSQFLHISYSHSLAEENCESIRRLMESEVYKSIFPDIKLEKKKQNHLKTSAGGHLYATGSDGTITGFGCGRQEGIGFGGGLIIDDPLNPSRIYSKVTREKVVTNYFETLKPRLNSQEKTFIIIIGQRVHQEDLPGFLIENEKDENWHVLKFPAIYRVKGKKEEYLANPVVTKETLKKIEKNSSYVFNSHYQQEPIPKGGLLFKEEWWKYYVKLPPIQKYIITGDTAYKTSEVHSFSVFQLWGLGDQDCIYLIDQIRGKWESPRLKLHFVSFYKKCLKISNKSIIEVFIEDKASGTGLIQDLKFENQLLIKGIQRNIDKVTRVYDTMPYIESGRVYLPKQSNWLSEYLIEFNNFSDLEKGNNRKDDQIDATLDAINKLLSKPAARIVSRVVVPIIS